MNRILLLKNNQNREWSDMEWVEEFYQFLQGNIPEEITMQDPPFLTNKRAFEVIWYLQEHFPVIPDNIEWCVDCGVLFDSNCEGGHHEEIGNFCDDCYNQAIFDGKIREET